jgi:hypothetical protein
VSESDATLSGASELFEYVCATVGRVLGEPGWEGNSEKLAVGGLSVTSFSVGDMGTLYFAPSSIGIQFGSWISTGVEGSIYEFLPVGNSMGLSATDMTIDIRKSQAQPGKSQG